MEGLLYIGSEHQTDVRHSLSLERGTVEGHLSVCLPEINHALHSVCDFEIHIGLIGTLSKMTWKNDMD